MPNHTITNTTTSMLDMSPMHDVTGRVLTLKPGESRDVDDVTYKHDIVQRVLKAKWLSVGTPAAVTPPTSALEPAPAAPEPTPAPEPEVTPPAPEPAAMTSEPPAMPTETPVVSEAPVEPAPKSSKFRR